MALDLVQIRWQQIRLVEASQVLEAENLALRKELEELKASKLAPAPVIVVQAPDVDAGLDRNLVMKQCSNMTNQLMRAQSELMKLKLYAAKEIAGMLHQKTLLSKAFDNLQTAYRIKDAEFEAIEYTRDELQRKLDEAYRCLEDGKNNSSAEVSKYKLKLKQANMELKDSEESKEKLSESHRVLNDKYNALLAAKSEVDNNYIVLDKEFQGMQGLVDKARADGEAALADSFNNKLFMQEQYEKIVEELSYENEYLRNTCAEQEAQIERLTNSLVGNKSHFARYVEVKTENLTLQSKLQAVTKSAKRAGVAEYDTNNTNHHSIKDPAGLPARRNKMAAAGVAAMAPQPHGNNNNNNNNIVGGNWASSVVRMPSPRGDGPVDFAHRAQLQTQQGPQSSPRGAGGQAAHTAHAAWRQSSGNSVSSQLSVLVEPTLLPPPISGIQPGRARTEAAPSAAPPVRPRGASFDNEGGYNKGSKKSLRFEPSHASPGPATIISKTVI